MRDLKEFCKDFVTYLLIFISVILIIKYVVSLEQVIGPSMQPNYKSGDLLVLNKLHYKLKKPKRFEIIVINNKETKYMIKRVIGLPGDKLEYKDNKLYINEKLVEENFKKEGITEDYKLENLNYEIIPDDYYFVLGDNRENSSDSRVYGLVSKKDIIGKVQFRIWPIFR